MRNYFKELDVYSGIAILFVVLIHSDGGYLLNVLKLGSYVDAGFFLLTIDQIVHIAVPMFIFAAGFKYRQPTNYRDYSMKRFKKVLFPFLFISIFFIFKNGIYNFLMLGLKSAIKIAIVDTIKIFFGYNIAYQLWYIPMYLFVVLSYPIIKKYIQNRMLRFYLFGTLSVLYVSLLSFTDLFVVYDSPFSFIYYLLFFEIGCFVAENKINKNKQFKLFLSYSVVLLSSIFIYKISNPYGIMITKLILTPIAVVAFYYISIFLKDNKILNTLGKCSFYIFLFHEPIILSYLTGLFNRFNLYNGYYITLIITALSILLSITLYELLKKIGLAKYIFYQK